MKFGFYSSMVAFTLIMTVNVSMAMSIEAQLEAVGVSIVENSNVFTEQYEWIEPHDQHTVTDELSFWVDKLPQDSMKNRSRYLVIPSQGIVAPINSIYQGDPDYERIKFGKTFELNRHLKNGILRYPFTGNPGKQGNMVLFGHSSYFTKDDGLFKTVFRTLPLLRSGDKIWIYNRGDGKSSYQKYEYIVDRSFETDPTNVSVMNRTPYSQVTLVGCTDIGTADKRRIVQAVLDGEKVTSQETYTAPTSQYTLENPTQKQVEPADTPQEYITSPETSVQDTTSQDPGEAEESSDVPAEEPAPQKDENISETIQELVDQWAMPSEHEAVLDDFVQRIQALPEDSQKRIHNKLEKYFTYIHHKVPVLRPYALYMQTQLGLIVEW